jgi:RNA polymerase sigma-70 factor (ECF subfamily)
MTSAFANPPTRVTRSPGPRCHIPRSVTGEEAYQKYSDELIRFATGLVGPADAADLVMDAMIRCIYGRRWQSVRNARAYLHQAVLRQALNHHRNTMRRRLREYASAPRESFAIPDIQTDVLRAVGRLSVRQRAVVFLTYWSDLSPTAVGQVLGIGEGSVRRHLARARARLKELLND